MIKDAEYGIRNAGLDFRNSEFRVPNSEFPLMTTPSNSPVWRLAHGRTLPLDRDVLVMGVLNVTPDSFSDGGLYSDVESAVAQGLMLARTDADIIDIGGESTRPGATPTAPAEQKKRILPVIRRLIDQAPKVAISIDTRSAEVAAAAIELGAHIINDISSLRHDPQMPEAAANSGAGVVLMHMLGTPETMQQRPRYTDVVAEVVEFLRERVDFAEASGVARERIAVDPGIGFGKLLNHNLELLANVGRIGELGLPVLIGPSRKRFIGDLTGAPVNERLSGTLAACVMAAIGGASIVRVHNPGPIRQAIKVAQAIRAAGRQS